MQKESVRGKVNEGKRHESMVWRRRYNMLHSVLLLTAHGTTD